MTGRLHPEAPPAEETCQQEVIRLLRELAQARALAATQQTVIRAERAEKEAAVETIRRIGDVLALPKDHMAPAPKILTIVALLEAHSRASRGVSRLPSAVLEERSGMSKNMVSTWIQDLAARANSPIKRRLTREWRTNEARHPGADHRLRGHPRPCDPEREPGGRPDDGRPQQQGAAPARGGEGSRREGPRSGGGARRTTTTWWPSRATAPTAARWSASGSCTSRSSTCSTP